MREAGCEKKSAESGPVRKLPDLAPRNDPLDHGMKI